MKFKKDNSGSTFLRWLALLIFPFNLWAHWKLAKIWANVEEQRGD